MFVLFFYDSNPSYRIETIYNVCVMFQDTWTILQILFIGSRFIEQERLNKLPIIYTMLIKV